ncbi:MAG TPA: DUF3035 domain-containing protein [Rhizomicrobium sp.]|jgi:hypothetical protein
MIVSKRAQACMVVLAAMVAVSGCSGVRKAAGLDKETPDEFAVVTKAPLVIPPDYNLRPPKPGAVPTNQLSPTATAQAALAGDDANGAATASNGAPTSPAEQSILDHADATNADHSIRQQIASDEKSMQGSDESFTDKLLFTGQTDNSDKPVNADAASHANTPGAAGQPAAQAPAAQTPAPAAKPDDSASSSKKSDDSGWFSWLGL